MNIFRIAWSFPLDNNNIIIIIKCELDRIVIENTYDKLCIAALSDDNNTTATNNNVVIIIIHSIIHTQNVKIRSDHHRFNLSY